MQTLAPDDLLELVLLVRDGVARRGYHELDGSELGRLWPDKPTKSLRLWRIHHFAQACGVRCEADWNLSQARFVPMGKWDDGRPLVRPVDWVDGVRWN